MPHAFSDRVPSLNGPAFDVSTVMPSDGTDLEFPAIALLVTTGGDLSIVTALGTTRTITVPDQMLLPVAVTRVRATDTTASGIIAFGIGT